MYRQTMNNKGYTLLTALYQLVVLLVASHIIILFIIVFYQYMNLEDDRDEMEWTLFTTDLNIYFERSHSVSVDKNNKTVYFVDPYTEQSEQSQFPLTYMIQVRENHVAKAVYRAANNAGAGHEIVLPYISRASFQLEGNILKFRAVMKSGEIRERDFVVTTYAK